MLHATLYAVATPLWGGLTLGVRSMSSSESMSFNIFTDPLSQLTRLERRNLLLASFIGVLIAKAGLVPTKFSAFGIDLTAPQQSAFTLAAALIVGYFLLAFLAYATPDLLSWREKYQDYLRRSEIAGRNWTIEDQIEHDEISGALPNIMWLYRSSRPVAYLRVAFDFVLPVLFAAYAIYALVSMTART